MKKIILVVITLVLCWIPASSQLTCSGGTCTPVNIGTGITDTTAILNTAGGTVHFGPGVWPTSSIGQSGNRQLLADTASGHMIYYNSTSSVAADQGWNISIGARMTDATADFAGSRLFGGRVNATSGNALGYFRVLVTNSGGTFTQSFQSALSGFNLVGTTAADDAVTGSLGEYLSSTVATGASVTLASGSATPITSINLTAGDWDVTGVVDYTPNAATSVTILSQGANATNNCMTNGTGLGAQDTYSKWETAANIIGASDPAWVIPVQRIAIASTTTVCLISNATFSVNTLKAYGTIRARRMR